MTNANNETMIHPAVVNYAIANPEVIAANNNDIAAIQTQARQDANEKSQQRDRILVTYRDRMNQAIAAGDSATVRKLALKVTGIMAYRPAGIASVFYADAPTLPKTKTGRRGNKVHGQPGKQPKSAGKKSEVSVETWTDSGTVSAIRIVDAYETSPGFGKSAIVTLSDWNQLRLPNGTIARNQQLFVVELFETEFGNDYFRQVLNGTAPDVGTRGPIRNVITNMKNEKSGFDANRAS